MYDTLIKLHGLFFRARLILEKINGGVKNISLKMYRYIVSPYFPRLLISTKRIVLFFGLEVRNFPGLENKT